MVTWYLKNSWQFQYPVFYSYYYNSISQVVINVFVYTEFLPEDGQERLQHVIFLPHVIDHYNAVVGICKWCIISLQGALIILESKSW